MDFSFPQVYEALAAAIPEREAIVFRDRRLSYARFVERSRRLANHLLARGLARAHASARGLAGHESGPGPPRALPLQRQRVPRGHARRASWRRVAPLNVNYRYVEEELALPAPTNSRRARGRLPRRVRAARRRASARELPELEVLLQVPDESGNALLPGAVDYEAALGRGLAGAARRSRPSPDDLYILYTGGTTACRRACSGARPTSTWPRWAAARIDGSELASLDERRRARAARRRRCASLIGPPLMHGAAQWATLHHARHAAARCIVPGRAAPLDPARLPAQRSSARRRVTCTIVGDAFARPLLDQLAKAHATTCRASSSSARAARRSRPRTSSEFLERIPHVDDHRRDRLVRDRRAGARNPSNKARRRLDRRLPAAGRAPACVSEDLDRVLRAGRRRARLVRAAAAACRSATSATRRRPRAPSR